MKLVDFAATSIEELPHLIKELSPMQIRASAEQLSEAQLAPVLHTLTEDRDPEWREKIIELVLGLTTQKKIETVGKTVTFSQASHLLSQLALNKKNNKEILSAVLIGIPHSLFLELLMNEQNTVFQVLKNEINTEAVQHHLTVLSHDIILRLIGQQQQSLQLINEIKGLSLSQLGRDDISSFTHRIDELSESATVIGLEISRLLQLAWNTDRIGLIETLSIAKEASIRLRQSIVGIPSSFKKPPTGLYLELQNKLFSVYGDSADPADIEAIKDDEPSIEALVKLSLWYIHDYWEVGLLPEIKTAHQVAAIPKKLRDHLFTKVQENLTKLGLSTAADLKTARIFSRKSLQEYVIKHSHKL